MNISSKNRLSTVFTSVIVTAITLGAFSHADFMPGDRVLMDAHNCYPYQGLWANRLERALSTGFPVAIEQDLVWFTTARGESRSIVSHGKPYIGNEPSLDEYFYEAIRPHMEKALRDGNNGDWPLITLNLDIKTNVIEHTRVVMETIQRYEAWTTSAVKTDDIAQSQPLDVKPLLVLSKGNGSEFEAFYEDVPVGSKLLVFGVGQTAGNREAAPEAYIPNPADNFRRWLNDSWALIEHDGQRRAADWTRKDAKRLKAIVDHAHNSGYWLRLYTLDGFDRKENKGWSAGYNFGSKEAAAIRWRASIETGVDFIASDQYEDLAELLRDGK